MASLIPNSFSSYDLTEEEEIQGNLLTQVQKQVIQNNIVNLAEEKINLVLDPTLSTEYVQREAGLAGQIAALRYRLELSESTEEMLKGIYQPEPPVN